MANVLVFVVRLCFIYSQPSSCRLGLRAGEAGSFALLWFECRMCGNANVPDCANETTTLSGGNYTQRLRVGAG